jgi:hypothetical protein
MAKTQGMTTTTHKTQVLILRLVLMQLGFKKEVLLNRNCVHNLRFRVSSNITLIMFIHQFMTTFVKVG